MAAIPQQIGTLTLSDLAVERAITITDFGVTNINIIIQQDMARHNAIVADMMSALVETTTDRARAYAGSAKASKMVEVDEMGRTSTTKSNRPGGRTVEFPLRRFERAIGWTQDWFDSHTPAEMATEVLSAQSAHIESLKVGVQEALYRSANYTLRDIYVDEIDLDVKRLVNADGTVLPFGMNGQNFVGSTHTHYKVGALIKADLDGLIYDVMEHGHVNGIKLVINFADENEMREVEGFNAYPDPRLTQINSATNVPNQVLDLSNIYSRAIGTFGPTEVVVRPWAIQGYAFACALNDLEKPLCMRQRDNPRLQGLRIVAEISSHPLNSQTWRAEFGFGVWSRTNGSILDFTGGGVYTDPL